MTTICPNCETIFTGENVKKCPNCNFITMVEPKPLSERIELFEFEHDRYPSVMLSIKLDRDGDFEEEYEQLKSQLLQDHEKAKKWDESQELSKRNPTDGCFINCYYQHCFAEHEFVKIAENVLMCSILKEQSIFGEANWD